MSASEGPSATSLSADSAAEIASSGPSGRLIKRVKLALRMVIYRLLCWAFCHMRPLRIFFALLRRFRPVARIGSTLWTTRADDVREVLVRFDDFELGQAIEPGMPFGTFIMSVDWRIQHALERGLLQSAIEPHDCDTIRLLVHGVCARAIENARETSPGLLDAVGGVAEPVAVAIAASYYGVSLPVPGQMADAMAHMAGIIMVNPPEGSEPWISSRQSLAEVTKALSDRIVQIRTMPSTVPANDLLTRLVRLQMQPGQPDWFTDDWIRRYVTGLIATGGATLVRGCAHALEQLLDHPEGLAAASGAAARLAADPEDAKAGKALRQAAYEALRFRPMLPLLVRDCPRQTVIAAGTERARIVPAGTRVFAPPLAAMWDPEVAPSPSSFRLDRSDSAYLIFGFGARECFGRFIADIVLVEFVAALARLQDLKRAAGAKGRIRYEGPAPRSLFVTFG